MQRIILHHTAGSYAPNAVDKRAYHRLVDGEGEVHDGLHPIAANSAGAPMAAGTYAPHCLNLNRGSIGLSICAMANAEWGTPAAWSHPVRPAQVDALVAEAARLCMLYGIHPSRRFVLSHAEVEPTLGVKQKAKWDFDYPLRGGPSLRDPLAIGDELRAEIVRALKGQHIAPPEPPALSRATLWQGSSGADVIVLQKLLGLPADQQDGQFGPRTRQAVLSFQTQRQLLPDGVVGPATWAALSNPTKGH